MPIYEFYCNKCNTIYNFFSRTVNTTKTPDCPKCKKYKLARQMSAFAVTGKAKEGSNDIDNLPFDESKLESAIQMLGSEADKINEDDPRQAAGLMRKLTNMTGIELGQGMEEALSRMEKGEDPEKIGAEMEDILENEEPFLLPDKKGKPVKAKYIEPLRDETLYDL
ncbi:MAG: zinc ribbon domain-containing protein [Desulfobacterales bacterium]|nr:zinc ribbon domain-containing protein [Desulfobacterales bacterium]